MRQGSRIPTLAGVGAEIGWEFGAAYMMQPIC
jgi:hypothetical protein